jgi:hypothetical protein
MTEIKDVYDWIAYGIQQGWCTSSFCNTHEGDPWMTPEEEQEWEDGGDPCLFVIKLV